MCYWVPDCEALYMNHRVVPPRHCAVGLLLSSLYTGGNWGSKELNDLPRGSEMIAVNAEFESRPSESRTHIFHTWTASLMVELVVGTGLCPNPSPASRARAGCPHRHFSSLWFSLSKLSLFPSLQKLIPSFQFLKFSLQPGKGIAKFRHRKVPLSSLTLRISLWFFVI